MSFHVLALLCVVISVNLVAPQGETKQFISCNAKAGWILNNGNCYFFGKNRKTWDDAKKDCADRNSQLVKINDVGENTWLKTLMKEYGSNGMWTGLNDHAKENRFVWLDKSRPTFTDWDGNQPDNAKNEDCIEIWNRFGKNDYYRWNDRTCSHKLNYMCEK